MISGRAIVSWVVGAKNVALLRGHHECVFPFYLVLQLFCGDLCFCKSPPIKLLVHQTRWLEWFSWFVVGGLTGKSHRTAANSSRVGHLWPFPMDLPPCRTRSWVTSTHRSPSWLCTRPQHPDLRQTLGSRGQSLGTWHPVEREAEGEF